MVLERLSNYNATKYICQLKFASLRISQSKSLIISHNCPSKLGMKTLYLRWRGLKADNFRFFRVLEPILLIFDAIKIELYAKKK